MTGPCEFRCRDTACLPRWIQVCDGRPDCTDSSDEIDCPAVLGGPPAPYTSSHQLASLQDISGVQICIIAIALVLTLGLITCVINHYNKMGARSWSERRRLPAESPSLQLPAPNPCPNIASALYSPTTAQERARLELSAFHDRQVRLQSVQRDFALDLPPSIHLPDGEEHPYSMKVIHLRTPAQESEIHRACIRPPPNRTVLDRDALPPYHHHRSHSRDHLHKKTCTPLTLVQTAKAPLVMRSHSPSSSSPSGGCPEGWLPNMLPAPHLPVAAGRYAATVTASELMSHLESPPPQYEEVVRRQDSFTHAVGESQIDGGV